MKVSFNMQGLLKKFLSNNQLGGLLRCHKARSLSYSQSV